MFANPRVFGMKRALPLLAPETEVSGAGGSSTQDEDPEGSEGLSDNDKDALKRMRQQREAARSEAKDAREKLAALQQEKAERETAEAAARDEEAKKKGEFEQLADQRGRDLDTAKGDIKGLKADNEALREAINGFLDDEWKALPDSVKAAYLGAEDDPLAKLRFLPKGKALADEISEKDPTKRGAGPDPKPKGPNGLPTAAQVADEMRRNRGYPTRAGG